MYTTRPDTIFGATYMVLAPEHPLLDSLTTAEQKIDVNKYMRKAALKSDLERTELQKVKTGVFTGNLFKEKDVVSGIVLLEGCAFDAWRCQHLEG